MHRLDLEARPVGPAEGHWAEAEVVSHNKDQVIYLSVARCFL